MNHFWEHVAKIYHKQPEATQPRTSGSLQSRFQHIAKVTQKYLAAAKLYRSAIPSGETEVDTVENIMMLYRESNKTNAKGVVKCAPEIRFMSAVKLLSKLPKFSMEVGGFKKRQSRKEANEGRENSQGCPGNISSAFPSTNRPAGAKRQNVAENNGTPLSKSVDNVAAALRKSAEMKRTASSISLQLKIIHSLDLSSEEKNSRLEKLLKQAVGMQHSNEDTNSASTSLQTTHALALQERQSVDENEDSC